MKVIIADSDPRKAVIGGIGIYSASLANRLVDAVFIGKAQPGPGLKELSYPVHIANKKPLQNNLLFFRSLFSFAKNFVTVDDTIIHAQRPDWIIPFQHHRGKKVISLHGSHYKNLRMKKGPLAAFIYGFLEKKGFKIADKVVAVDARTKEEYEYKYPFAKDKIVVVPVGIDTKKFVPLPKSKVLKELGLSSQNKIFLFVGRLSKEKRVHLMIENLKQDETLLIIGTGEEEAMLSDLVGDKDVRFLGAKGQDDLVKYYTVADALLLFSTHEGLPTVALESLACGTPVICTPVGELPVLIEDGKTGFIVKKEGYRKAMNQLSKKRIIMDKDCRKKALQYDWKNIVKQLEKEVYA